MESTLYKYGPMEQFETVWLIGKTGRWTNMTSTMLIGVWLNRQMWREREGLVVTTRWASMYEMTYTQISKLVRSSGIASYVSMIWVIVVVISMNNVIGLVPYSVTPTAQLIGTLTISTMVWLGKLKIGVRRVGLIGIMGTFIPAGIPFGMTAFFALVESLGFVIPLVSLAVRLFANIMSGHVLMKVLIGFSWTMMLGGGVLWLSHIVPMAILVVLYGMETGVALVQAYVFGLLTVLYGAEMEGR